MSDDGNTIDMSRGTMTGESQGWDGSLTTYRDEPDGIRFETHLVYVGRWRVRWTARILNDDGVSVRTGKAWGCEHAHQCAVTALASLSASFDDVGESPQ